MIIYPDWARLMFLNSQGKGPSSPPILFFPRMLLRLGAAVGWPEKNRRLCKECAGTGIAHNNQRAALAGLSLLL
jgi:hypothetical protein